MPDSVRRSSAWWQLIIASAGLVLALVLAFAGVANIFQAQHAIDTAKSATQSEQQLRSAAIARITSLTAQIAALSAQAQTNAGRIAALLTEVKALSAQVASLGGTPVVVETQTVIPASPQTTARPTGHPSPSAAASSHPGKPSASPSTPASPSPTPSPSRRCLLPGVCV